MRTLNQILGIGMLLSFLACNSPKYDKNVSEDSAAEIALTLDSTAKAETSISSSAAVEDGKQKERKFIRTADLKFKVKDVIKSTYQIEDITTRHNGFVTYTNLASEINDVNTTSISADSSLETTKFTIINNMTIRVPNTKLDTVLKEIAKNIDFLDYRIIQADDVALQILANDLTQKRSSTNEQRLSDAIQNRGKKLRETTAAEELLWKKQEQADQAKINNLSLYDQVNFSTITLNIYQKPSVKRELIANEKNIKAYEPNFGNKFVEALQIGWNILEELLLVITRIWTILLAIVLTYLIWRKFLKKER